MLFKKEKQQQQSNKQIPDYGQKIFKAAAFVFLIFVLYETYSNDLKNRLSNSSEDEIPEQVSQARINQKVQEAFDKMYENPEYKKIQDFVNYIDKNIDKNNGTALKTPSGYLLFLPFDSVFNSNAINSKIVIKSEETEFYVDYKITHKAIEAPNSNIVQQARNSDIQELKENIEKTEKNILLEEIAKKNGKVINLIDKDLPKPVAYIENNHSAKASNLPKSLAQKIETKPTDNPEEKKFRKVAEKQKNKPVATSKKQETLPSDNNIKPVSEAIIKKPIDLKLD
ncbi:MAG: hypothetical protein SFT90_03805 [Rickettsiales bacterium]|nr:hypothetical protein [Rickettsiales bacterium]